MSFPPPRFLLVVAAIVPARAGVVQRPGARLAAAKMLRQDGRSTGRKFRIRRRFLKRGPTMRLRLPLAFAAVVMSVAAFAAEARAQSAVTFSLDFRALGRHAAWYVALEKGYYKQAGLDVTIIPSQGTAQAIQSVESKAAQFAFSDVAGLVAARANSGATAKMVAVIYQKAPYAVFSLRSGANVSKPEQLENLEIATGAGSFTQKVIEAYMRSRGLKAETVKWTNIDPAARVGLLAAKKIPAIETFAMSMPGVVKAVGGADAQIFMLANNGLQLYSNGILVREDYLKAEPDKVKGFVKASLQGWKDAIANPKEAADIAMKHIKGLDAEVALQEIVIVNALVSTPDTKSKGLGTIDAKLMTDSVDLIAKNTGADGKVAAKDVYDTSALPAPPIK
jgi:NitT/TauT family transport system substrate-binding protein